MGAPDRGTRWIEHALGDRARAVLPGSVAELAMFVNTVSTGGESACTLHEARAALAVAVAADRSRAERRPVSTETSGAPALKS